MEYVFEKLIFFICEISAYMQVVCFYWFRIIDRSDFYFVRIPTRTTFNSRSEFVIVWHYHDKKKKKKIELQTLQDPTTLRTPIFRGVGRFSKNV